MEPWYLKKHDDGTIYGPATLDQLRNWALSAKISPLDRISNDRQKTWKRAPMVPELHMDWLIQVTDEFLYGPTTFGTVQEFISSREIDDYTEVINCTTGKRMKVKDMPVAFNSPRRAKAQDLVDQSMKEVHAPLERGSEHRGDQVLRLERTILQLRLALNDTELRYRELEKKYRDATGLEP